MPTYRALEGAKVTVEDHVIHLVPATGSSRQARSMLLSPATLCGLKLDRRAEYWSPSSVSCDRCVAEVAKLTGAA